MTAETTLIASENVHQGRVSIWFTGFPWYSSYKWHDFELEQETANATDSPEMRHTTRMCCCEVQHPYVAMAPVPTYACWTGSLLFAFSATFACVIPKSISERLTCHWFQTRAKMKARLTGVRLKRRDLQLIRGHRVIPLGPGWLLMDPLLTLSLAAGWQPRRQ